MNLHFVSVLLLILFVCSLLSDATLSPTFRQFLRQNYGESVDKELSREDIGGGGSFGGGTHRAGQPTKHLPVIFVHGTTSNAGSTIPIKNFFRKNGYDEDELYATTYGDAGKTNILFVTLKCQYVKVIRQLIQAVAKFTAGKVNVIAYSFGSPIARKALLGGKCVDTDEELGPPLTNLVDTFVGVAGANWGSALCAVPLGACNSVNGLSCGSRFLKDINSKKHHYEGHSIYTIYSTGDELVGHKACGKIASSIPGQNGTFKEVGLLHDSVINSTAKLQYNLIACSGPCGKNERKFV